VPGYPGSSDTDARDQEPGTHAAAGRILRPDQAAQHRTARVAGAADGRGNRQARPDDRRGAARHVDDVYVHSNQPGRTVTAAAGNGACHGYRTDSSGYADVYLSAAAGDMVKVRVGSASCSATA